MGLAASGYRMRVLVLPNAALGSRPRLEGPALRSNDGPRPWSRGVVAFAAPPGICKRPGQTSLHIRARERNPVVQSGAVGSTYHLYFGRPLVCLNALHLEGELIGFRRGSPPSACTSPTW